MLFLQIYPIHVGLHMYGCATGNTCEFYEMNQMRTMLFRRNLIYEIKNNTF